jgi:outer membrane protein OmpA-like peptidoglycan-associated protein
MTIASSIPLRFVALIAVGLLLGTLSLRAGIREGAPGRSAPGFGGDTITKVYSMIHFEADSARITPVQQRILKEYVFDGILSERNPVIDVIGYTDVMGTSDHNLRLSLRRAESVAGAIRKGIGASHYRSLTARGVGENETRFTNDLPEGRFYNRTVRVLVTSAKD